MGDKILNTEAMTAEGFKRLRENLGINITHCALLFNMSSARTIRRYEDGDTPISGPAGILLKVLAEVPGAFEYVDRLAQKRSGEIQ
jgi:DNA-binding transcriptional regulator YiaG